MYLSKWDDRIKKTVEEMSTQQKDRLEAIIAMNTMVINMNDENAYVRWIYLVPDGADEWDFVDFATNDKDGADGNHLFDEAVELFKELWKSYAMEDKGLYIGGKCY